MNETISLQINKCKTFIDFMLSQQQWSGLQKSDVESWLKNFKDVQSGERLLVYKLLSNIIYFSEADVIAALKEGIYKCLYYSVILEKQINAKFSMSQQALAAVCQEELENTYFIPLLDSNSPHESGNYIMRLLVQQNIIQPRQSVFLESLPDIFISRKISLFNNIMPLSSPELLGRGRTVPAIRASGWRNHRPAHPARDAEHFRSAASSPPDSGSSAPNDP